RARAGPFCYQLLPPPPRSTLFPYTTLFRSAELRIAAVAPMRIARSGPLATGCGIAAVATSGGTLPLRALAAIPALDAGRGDATADRKSTRLNSSHVAISYAVFCLKKKKNTS